MKNLIIYYSRTGNTRKIAETLAKMADWDIEEVQDDKNRLGALGYLLAGRDATLRKIVQLKPLKSNLATYDLVVVGTPVWSFNISAPIRSFLRANKNNLKKVAFFCTMGSTGSERTFAEMEKECGINPLSTIEFVEKKVTHTSCEERLKEFVSKIKNGLEK